MPPLSSKSYTFDPRPDCPFLVTANRYRLPSSPRIPGPGALTLVLAHGTGFSKEHWEPTIEHLYHLIGSTTSEIREVWSIDAPNHGDAAVLNEETLQWGYQPICTCPPAHASLRALIVCPTQYRIRRPASPRRTVSWEEYARSIHALLRGLGTGVDADFSAHNLVAIGHSMGAISLSVALPVSSCLALTRPLRCFARTT